MALTLKTVSKTKAAGRYADGDGLYLQVSATGAKSWLFRYERDGRERWMGLGSATTFALPEARERARRARQQLWDGLDPLETRKADKAARAVEAAKTITFEVAAQSYYDQHADKWKNLKHRAQFLSTLKAYAYPTFGKLPVADIDTPLVLKALEKIWKAKPETADRVRNRIETVLDWCTTRGYRKGDNPARWKGHLQNVLPARAEIQKVKHHPALPFAQAPEFIVELRKREAVAARALEFLILCAARSGAVRGAVWPEIDFDKKIWTVPPDRAGTKIFGDEPRRVPLSDRAIEILQALPREDGNPHVFIGGKKGGANSDAALGALIERMNDERKRNGLPPFVDPKTGNKQITPHGFRSCFKDWATECTHYPAHVSEAALWHAVSDKVEAAYRRSDLLDKRKKLMEAWSNYCGSKSWTDDESITELRHAG